MSLNLYYTESPLIVVEVLSKATHRTDHTIKQAAYLTLPSLQEYVLIEQDIADVEVVRRLEGWQSKHYFLDDDITFESIDLTLSVEEIYLRVHNNEVIDFLSKKSELADSFAG